MRLNQRMLAALVLTLVPGEQAGLNGRTPPTISHTTEACLKLMFGIELDSKQLQGTETEYLIAL